MTEFTVKGRWHSEDYGHVYTAMAVTTAGRVLAVVNVEVPLDGSIDMRGRFGADFVEGIEKTAQEDVRRVAEGRERAQAAESGIVTLIITDLSKHGVAMAADSAETQEVKGVSGRKYARILVGVRKLHAISRLRGAVAFWGLGHIHIGTEKDLARIPTDIWIEDFIERNSHLANLEQFAHTLKSELQKILGSEATELGFHVAGIGNKGEALFYRVCNHTKSHERKPEFEVDKAIGAAKYKEVPVTLFDGDTGVYEQLIKRFEQGKSIAITSHDSPIPHDSLSGRREYHAAWIRFVSDLYQSGNLLQTIGGGVNTVAIDINGNFEPI